MRGEWKYLWLVLSCTVFILSGCSKETSGGGGGKSVELEFVAGFAELTKTSVDAEGKVDWSAGDVIRYYTASGGTVGSTTVTEACHSTSFKVTAGDKDSFIIAAYGGQISENQGEGLTLGGAVKGVQDGKFEDAHVSVCKRFFESGNTLNFKNVTSLMKFSLKRSDVSYVTFTADDGMKIQGDGKLYVTFDGESISSVKFGDSEGGSSIRVNTGGSGTFYISTLPCSFTGFTVCYFDDSDEVLGRTVYTGEVTLPAGVIMDFGEIDSRIYGGTVVTGSIFSDTLNATVKYNVYLPDSYGRSNKQYPIVYLLHGLGGNYTNWANSGDVAKTSDDLMGSGEADEMIIVMPNAGGGNYHYVQHGYFNVTGWHYENFFFKEFIPEMERRYRAIGDRGHRAIMGLSMGGGGSVVYCQHHPEMFSSCYAMSGWFYLRPYEEKALDSLTRDKFYLTCESVMVNSTLKFLDNADEQTIKNLKTVKWVIDCGDKDYIAEESKATYDKMTEVGIESEYTVRSGAHTWEYWRQSLRLALPFATENFYDGKKLFKFD